MRLFRKDGKKEKQVADSAATVSEGAGPADTGMLQRFRSGLSKTRAKIAGGLWSVLPAGRRLDDEIIEELEEQLFLADIGAKTALYLCDDLKDAYRSGRLENTDEVLPFLKARIKDELKSWDTGLKLPQAPPAVILVVGVNGSGKTTSIGKLAARFRSEGKSVLLAACDTFRAAAGEQLGIWAQWTQSDIVRNESADPAAVVFDAMDKAISREYDVLIADTAGRVHTRENLMSELQKIQRVISRKAPGAPHEILMVLDANTGQNGISQALKFSEYLDITGLVLAKLDGTARGGIVIGMRELIDIPVKFVGLGQQPQDMEQFDPEKFVDALFLPPS